MSAAHQLLIIVEDNENDEALALRAVSRCGVPCDVKVIRHGGEAIQMILSEDFPSPDLVVLDFHLPGYNGLEILRQLRANEKTRFVPIVILSALELSEEVAECLTEGANSCVQKPVEPASYVERVAMIVKYWFTIDRRPDQSEHYERVSSVSPGHVAEWNPD